MITLRGKTGSYGYAIGCAYIRNENAEVDIAYAQNTSDEIDRLKQAVFKAAKQLESLKSGTDDTTVSIIDAQIALLTDQTYIDRISQRIESDKVVAEYAVWLEGNAIADELSKVDSEYISGRSEDIRGITQKLTQKLTGMSEMAPMLENTIVVADELTPEYVSMIDRTKVCGLVSRRGSKTSHVAILCENYGIPYIYGIDVLNSDIVSGTELAMNADEATLYLCPDEQTKKSIKKCRDESEIPLQMPAGEPGYVKVMANISNVKDVENVLKAQADGIGLYRTEFLFMGQSLPTEEEQFEAYQKVAKAMDGREVIIRTIDIGADKKTTCISLPKEENPALGKRAIRICLEDTKLFRTQLRAILRASCNGNVSVMYPMITSAWEIREIKAQVDLAAAELKERGVEYAIPKQGVMIETPAAAILSDELAEYVDFFSIGTNDLTQYTLALDRTQEELERFYAPYSEAIFRLIEIVINNAHQKGVRVGICGELGGDINAIPRLIRMGIDELSMAPSKIQRARAQILSKYKFEESVTELEWWDKLFELTYAERMNRDYENGFKMTYFRVEEEKDTILIETMYLPEEKRGAGIGTSIMNDFLEEYSNQNIRLLAIEDRRDWYISLGFETVKRIEENGYVSYVMYRSKTVAER